MLSWQFSWLLVRNWSLAMGWGVTGGRLLQHVLWVSEVRMLVSLVNRWPELFRSPSRCGCQRIVKNKRKKQGVSWDSLANFLQHLCTSDTPNLPTFLSLGTYKPQLSHHYPVWCVGHRMLPLDKDQCCWLAPGRVEKKATMVTIFTSVIRSGGDWSFSLHTEDRSSGCSCRG